MFCFITLGVADSSSVEEDDSQQQQQQTINAESLEEFSTQIKTKGKVEKLVTSSETPPTTFTTTTSTPELDPCLEEKRVGRCKAAIPR